ncbi:hypothetical protein [Streptomyces sp. NPDC048442]|uniref:hypothetical protein n=1 Tax=Streptomyces sp. NPDC048442 TaxID=3154823 RepID=UPI0034284CC4
MTRRTTLCTTLRTRGALVAVTLVLGVAATACAESGPGTSGPTGARTPAAPPTTPAAPPTTPAAPPTTPAGPRTPIPTPTSPAATPPVRLSLTQDDAGRTLALAVGGVAQLRLTGSARWADAVTDGPEVTLVPVDYESDPGFREWEVRAVRAGTVAVRVGERGGGPGVRIGFRVLEPVRQ